MTSTVIMHLEYMKNKQYYTPPHLKKIESPSILCSYSLHENNIIINDSPMKYEKVSKSVQSYSSRFAFFILSFFDKSDIFSKCSIRAPVFLCSDLNNSLTTSSAEVSILFIVQCVTESMFYECPFSVFIIDKVQNVQITHEYVCWVRGLFQAPKRSRDIVTKCELV